MTLAFLGGIGMIETLLIFIFLCGFLLPVIALIDVVRSNFRGQNDKIMWALIIILFPFFGTLLYFIIGRTQKIA